MVLEIWSGAHLLERAYIEDQADVPAVMRNYYGASTAARPLLEWFVLANGLEVAAGCW